MRSLQVSCRAPAVGTFVDCLEHSLAGEHPAWQLREQMQKADTYNLSCNSIADRVGELLAVDLNPVGQLLRLAISDAAYRCIWDFYNKRGNVVSQVNYEGLGRFNEFTRDEFDYQATRREKIIVAASHEKILFSFRAVLVTQLHKNQDAGIRQRKLEDSAVSAVARIFGANQLILELSEFFEEYPTAKVNEAYMRLSAHPRLVERRMRELGITAVKIKQACMLSRATHQILWGTRTLHEIAVKCGYTHGAHLSRSFCLATGGITPSFLRSAARA